MKLNDIITERKNYMRMGKFLSYLLRHNPSKVDLQLSKSGWANVDELLSKTRFTKDDLDIIVSTDNKQRFVYNDGETQIRANQGHSIDVDLGLNEVEPPSILYHGTPINNVGAIEKSGIKKMSRYHVHLSVDEDTAHKVGARRGEHIIMVINAKAMYEDGYKFYKSENGVWLTDVVPPKYIKDSV